MKLGKWLAPRYSGKEIFHKDYSKIDMNPVSLTCPGCRAPVKMSRTTSAGRIGGWCKTCNRAVSP